MFGPDDPTLRYYKGSILAIEPACVLLLGLDHRYSGFRTYVPSIREDVLGPTNSHHYRGPNAALALGRGFTRL